MSFLFPLFLIAGLSLAIPLLIHLFNLRRYKTVYFPHTRFLTNIQLTSRKQSQLRYKWLLAARLFFLGMLVLAFAQPYFNNGKKDNTNNLHVIYIDNSYSMAAKKGARTLLDIAKDAATMQVKQATGSRYLLLTNDKPAGYQPLTADNALAEIGKVNISPANKSLTQVLTSVQSMVQNEAAGGADVYYYSDFQRSAVGNTPDTGLLRNITFYGASIQADAAQHVYIDTAYLATPTLQAGQTNRLIVHTVAVGKTPTEAPVLQLNVNGQVKSAASLTYNKNERTDTLDFQVNDAGWQHIMLTLNEAGISYDDTFRIAARSTPNLSVLLLSEGQTNAYLQAAFRSYAGFRLTQSNISNAPADWKAYSLVLLDGITHINNALGKSIATALQQGQSICIFPGKAHDVAALNEGLKQIADLQLTGIDTAVQAAAMLQQGSALVKDLFEKIPDNVQLPVANWHYVISAGLTANQQSILSFRNGDPFLARYTPDRGQLYICATSADLTGGNFPGSYFFAPFLYQMAVQSGSGDVFAITADAGQPAYLSLQNAGERNMVHLYGNGVDAIPPQRPNAAGLDVFVDQSVKQQGFYQLAAQSGDTTLIALNGNRSESRAELWSVETLQKQWKNGQIHWLQTGNGSAANKAIPQDNFPLWKVCAILAVLMLAVETYLLAGSFRKQNVAI